MQVIDGVAERVESEVAFTTAIGMDSHRATTRLNAKALGPFLLMLFPRKQRSSPIFYNRYLSVSLLPIGPIEFLSVARKLPLSPNQRPCIVLNKVASQLNNPSAI